MRQTIDNPKFHIEENRDEMVKAKWRSLSDADKIMHKLQFVADLKFEYHKPFFEKQDIEQIINERWFRQYFESIHFADDEFKRS